MLPPKESKKKKEKIKEKLQLSVDEEKTDSREIPVKGAEVVFSVVQWITDGKREAAQTWRNQCWGKRTGEEDRFLIWTGYMDK